MMSAQADLGAKIANTMFMHRKRAKRVLLVEDSEDDAYLSTRELNKWGCAVTRVQRGSEAMAAAKRAVEDGVGFDIAIVDLKLLCEEGLDVARALKSEHGEGLEVMICSGTLDPNQVTAALKAGFVLTPKPLRVRAIRGLAGSMCHP